MASYSLPGFFGNDVLSQDEDEEYERSQESIQRIATLQSGAKLPDWLTTNPDSLMTELATMYRNVPNRVNARGIAKAYDSAIGTAQGMGGQIANNAATEAVARAGISGGQINSGMVKAQSMLPVYETTSKLKVDKAATMLEANKASAAMQTDIAGTMANLRTNYLTALGNLQINKQNSENSWVMGQQGIRQKQQDADRDYELSIAGLASRGAGASGGGGSSDGGFDLATGKLPNGVGNMGYITNSGPITGALTSAGPMDSGMVGQFGGTPAAIVATGNGKFGGGGREMLPNSMKKKPISVAEWLAILGGAPQTAAAKPYVGDVNTGSPMARVA